MRPAPTWILLLLLALTVACGPTRRGTTDDDDGDDDDDTTPPPGTPSTPGIDIQPAAPGIEDDLVLSITEPSTDPDGDDVAYVIRWTLNNAPLAAWDDQYVITGETTNPDDTWEASVAATDGETDSVPAVASVTVLNAVPEVDTLIVSGAPALTDGILSVVWSVSDADDATLDTSAEWHVNGTPTGESGESLDGATWFDKGDEVTFVVQVSDPWHAAVVVESTPVVVQNSPPTEPLPAITPDNVAEGDDSMQCVLQVASIDLDGDPISYAMTWEVDGSPTSGTTETWPGDWIDAASLFEDEVWVCFAEASDGEDASPLGASASVTVDGPLPDLVVSSPMTLTDGVYLYDDVIVQTGVLLTIVGNVTILADTFTVETSATVSGNDAGDAGGALASSGSGPGGGGSSSNAGAGGGGHGGSGGNSGYDSGDAIGAGGSIHGDATSASIEVGSGGGGSTSAIGGTGGGALEVEAETIVVHGTITMNGNDAGSFSTCGADNRCAGGGAGGGILLSGDELTIDGALHCAGGAGGIGADTFADSGGGGGGGRIKIFFDTGLDDFGVLYDSDGGPGGPHGGTAGDDGIDGSLSTAYAAF